MLAGFVGDAPFFEVYVKMIIVSGLFLAFYSGIFYYLCYVRYKDEAWPYKTQQRKPSAETVQREIKWAFIALFFGVLCPTISVWLQTRGWNMMYSDISQYGYGYWFFSWFCLFWANETFEWYWHKKCHEVPILWELHKVHHRFHNPTPISVISNHPLDIFVQASPLLWFPFIMPIHDTTLYLHYAVVAYLYGAYLHAGFDWPFSFTSPHSKYFITAWHHNHHHHHSHFGKPLNTGFVLSIVDKLGGTFEGPGEKGEKCTCPHCRIEKEEKKLK